MSIAILLEKIDMKLIRLNRVKQRLNFAKQRLIPMHIINNWLCKRSRGNWNLCLSFSSAWFSVHVNCILLEKIDMKLKKAKACLTKAEPGYTKADPHAYNE